MQTSNEAVDAFRSRIIGCWRMISWTRKLVGSAEEADALGPNPFGYISYTPEGRVMVFVLKSTRQRPVSNVPTDSEKIGDFDSMFAYVGSCEVLPDRVINTLYGSWNELWTGTTQVRLPSFEDDQLVYGTPRDDRSDGRQALHVQDCIRKSGKLWRMRPNPSVKSTRNSRPHRPRGACSNLAPRGRHGMLPRAAYLERKASRGRPRTPGTFQYPLPTVALFKEPNMKDTVAPLVLDLVEWIGSESRPYSEVMEAWRTSCPRLPVWETANELGYLEQFHPPRCETQVRLSPIGQQVLLARRNSQRTQSGSTIGARP
jgi:hypothetical protein